MLAVRHALRAVRAIAPVLLLAAPARSLDDDSLRGAGCLFERRDGIVTDAIGVYDLEFERDLEHGVALDSFAFARRAIEAIREFPMM